MMIYLVYDLIDYESRDVVAVFSREDTAREYARTSPLFTDARSISRAELDSTDPTSSPEQIAYYRRYEKDKF